jgi:hypothetical protein
MDAIPALTGAPEQIRLATRMRAGRITTMLDMQANLTGHDAVSSAISKLLHIALRQFAGDVVVEACAGPAHRHIVVGAD